MTKILVVDDDRATRFALQKALTSSGFRTTVAKDSVEALQALRSRRFDLMLLDLWMPRVNGLELLAQIRKRKTKPHVLLMTSDDAPQALLNAVRENALKHVHKPVDSPGLLQTIREVLQDVPPIEVISARSDWVELMVPCTREAVDRIEPLMAHLEADLAAELREAIAYAFRELLLNAIDWCGRPDSRRRVRIACLRSPRMVMYRIADSGPGFTIDNGFGLLMLRANVDELLYNEKRNEVVFVKFLNA